MKLSLTKCLCRKRETSGAQHGLPIHGSNHRPELHHRPSGGMDVVHVVLQTQRPLSHRRRPQAQAGLLWSPEHGDPQPGSPGQQERYVRTSLCSGTLID